MPRRNRPARRRRRTAAPEAPAMRQLTTGQMAELLVRSGLASPAVLDRRPSPPNLAHTAPKGDRNHA